MLPAREPAIWRENPFARLFDLASARRVLGFEPTYDARGRTDAKD